MRVGFILLPRFTLTAFAGFLDVLRLAADEADRSRPLRCSWAVLGARNTLVEASSGVSILVQEGFDDPRAFDYLVVAGGLLHGGQRVPAGVLPYLRRAAASGVKIVGLCTGTFALARAGLLDGYLACVSWFHHEEFQQQFPKCKAISSQMYVVDRDRLTCAGGTSVIHLAAYIVERGLNRATAVKALRIMLERQPLPPRTLQPECVLSESAKDSVVRRAMLLLEQHLTAPARIERLARSLSLSRRQLERRFHRDVGMSPLGYRQRLRMERSRWLLECTDLRVDQIALECGFQSAAHFGRVIRQRFGCTPLQVRAARAHGNPQAPDIPMSSAIREPQRSPRGSRANSSRREKTYGANDRAHSTR